MKFPSLNILNLLEKFSVFLDKISSPMERRMAYFFCGLQILISSFAEAIAIGFFVVEFRKPLPNDIRIVLILFVIIVTFLVGSYIHMLITRDLKHIRDTDPNKKRDPAKERKIEF